MNEVEIKCFMLLCDRVEVLEKKVADLEVQVQSQQAVNTNKAVTKIKVLLDNEEISYLRQVADKSFSANS